MKDQYLQLIDKLPGNVALVQCKRDEIIIKSCNSGFRQLLGYSESALSVLVGELLPVCSDDKNGLVNKMTNLVNYEENNETQAELCLYNKDGVTIDVKCSVSCYDKDELLFITMVYDLSDIKVMQEELNISNEMRLMVQDLIVDFVFDYDVSKGAFHVDNRYSQLLGLELSDNSRIPLELFISGIHERDQENFMKAFNRAQEEADEGIVEIRMIASTKHNEPIYNWIRIYYKGVIDRRNLVSHVLFRATNIEFLKRVDTEEIAELDELTSLPNREATTAAIHKYLETTDDMHALIFIDYDDFGRVNELFGRAYGDQVIQTQAAKIQKLFRTTDIVGRYSGNQLLILMKNINKVLVLAVMSSLCESIKLKIRTEKEEFDLTASIGVSFYPEDGQTFDQLFARAEMAMRRSKMEGKNRYNLADHGMENLSKLQEFVSAKEEIQVVAKRSNRDFVSYCFEMLTNSPNVENAINLAIAAIGEHYDLEAIGVFLFERKENQAIRTNKWVTIEGIWESPYMLFSRGTLREFEELFDEEGILSYNSMQNSIVSKFHDTNFSEHEIKSTMYCKFRHSDIVQGCIGFQNLNKNHIWEESEKKNFVELTNILGVFIGLRQQREDDKRIIKQLQRRDHLTGLLTEDAFREQLSVLRQKASNEGVHGIAYMDIDGFSYVNENFGMEAGNQILREFSRIVVHEDCELVFSRFFSDLFVAYIHSDTDEHLKNRIVGIEEKFKEKANLYYPAGHLRLTAGLYMWDIQNIGSDMALENANLAREEAKNIGACSLRIYRNEMREEKTLDRLVTSEFHQTLREGRIELYMQPKFDLNTFKICGSEALARWRKSDGTLRMPANFINSLEKVGYIAELDFFIFEQTLSYMKKWKELGYKLFVISSNFSRKHFREPGVHQLIEDLTDRYGIPHQYIEIELTETIFSTHRDIVADELEALRHHQFRVAIDDFGTGYSSLSMLWDLPVDLVKLDRSFLNIENFNEKKRFVELLGEMIKSTDEDIIFEGIETVEQLEFLKDCGFTMGQGYVFSKPIPMDEFENKYIF